MIAALPMYDLPWLRAETDQFWQEIVTRLPDAPDALTRDGDLWDIWQSPELLLAQTCGLPYRASLRDRVRLVATPVHDLPDCPPGMYFSQFLRRKGDTRGLLALTGGVMAVNEGLSQSGWAAPLAHMTKAGIAPRAVQFTGAHFASMAAVATGKADFAAVDAVTLQLVAQGAPDLLAALNIFDRTTPTPALPYISALQTDPAPLFAALDGALAALPAQTRKRLGLCGVTQVAAEAYLALPIPSPPPG